MDTKTKLFSLDLVTFGTGPTGVTKAVPRVFTMTFEYKVGRFQVQVRFGRRRKTLLGPRAAGESAVG